MSSYEIKELNEETVAQWDRFVKFCPEATFFHRAGWKQVLESVFRHRTYFLYALRGREIVGVLPLAHVHSRLFSNGLISLPFCVAGGPAVAEEEARAALTDRARKLLDEVRADYLEVRDPPTSQHGWVRREGLYATFARETAADEEANLRQIPRRQRAVIRHAFEYALEIRMDEEADDFYRLFSLSLRNHGTPAFPRAYFVALKKVFGPDCEILTVLHEGTPVSTVLTFFFRDQVMPYYTGYEEEGRQMGANEFLYFRLMRHGLERGCPIFDFGRSKVGTGPYNFKKNWGFEPRPVVHEFLLRPGLQVPEINPANPKYKFFIALWKRMPVALANMVGPHIVRNLG